MAVQKSRRTRSTRGMRRNHDKLTVSQVSTDQETGELHLRHHITPGGYYKGRQVIAKKEDQKKKQINKDANKKDDEIYYPIVCYCMPSFNFAIFLCTTNYYFFRKSHYRSRGLDVSEHFGRGPYPAGGTRMVCAVANASAASGFV